MKNYHKKSKEKASSADGVNKHLQGVEDKEVQREQLYYSQEQAFSSNELSSVINEARLNELLAQSDDFLNCLNIEIDSFDEDDMI